MAIMKGYLEPSNAWGVRYRAMPFYWYYTNFSSYKCSYAKW